MGGCGAELRSVNGTGEGSLGKSRGEIEGGQEGERGQEKTYLDEVLHQVKDDGLVGKGHERLGVGQCQGTKTGTETCKASRESRGLANDALSELPIPPTLF